MIYKAPVVPFLLPLPLTSQMINKQPIIEVGCGNGHFLVEQATNNLDKIFIGCDIKKNRIEKTLSKIRQNKLSNAFVVYGRGEELLASFPKNSLGGFYMNFPDPWWKKKYHKRRFFYLQTDVDNLVEKLVENGFISFISDHQEYFQHVFTLLAYHHLLIPQLQEGFITTQTTDYNTMFALRWQKEGRTFFQTEFKKILVNNKNSYF